MSRKKIQKTRRRKNKNIISGIINYNLLNQLNSVNKVNEFLIKSKSCKVDKTKLIYLINSGAKCNSETLKLYFKKSLTRAFLYLAE